VGDGVNGHTNITQHPDGDGTGWVMVGKGLNGLIDITPAPRRGWDGVGDGGRGWVMVSEGGEGAH